VPRPVLRALLGKDRQEKRKDAGARAVGSVLKGCFIGVSLCTKTPNDGALRPEPLPIREHASQSLRDGIVS
jgi:hypothetical protein